MFLGLVSDVLGFYTLNPKQVFCPKMGLLEAAAFFHRAFERLPSSRGEPAFARGALLLQRTDRLHRRATLFNQ